MSDRSGKTEEPTHRRLEKARKEGQFAQAKEFVAALQFLLFLGLLGAGGPAWLASLRQTTRAIFSLAFAGELGVADLTAVAWTVSRRLILPLILAGVAITLLTLGLRLATTRFGFSWKKLAPDAKRFNPITKLRELPRNNLPQVLQAVILLPLFLGAVYVLARDRLDAFLALPLETAETGARFLNTSLMDLF